MMTLSFEIKTLYTLICRQHIVRVPKNEILNVRWKLQSKKRRNSQFNVMVSGVAFQRFRTKK